MLLIKTLVQFAILLSIAISVPLLLISALPPGPQKILVALIFFLLGFTVLALVPLINSLQMLKDKWKSFKQKGHWEDPLTARIFLSLWWLGLLILFTWGMVLGLGIVLLH